MAAKEGCETQGAAETGIDAATCRFWDCTGRVMETYTETTAPTGRIVRVLGGTYLPSVVCPRGAYAAQFKCPPGWALAGPFVDVRVTEAVGYKGAMCCKMVFRTAL